MGLLEGKVALVTGGTSGIGAASAILFASEGAKVVLTGRREAEGQEIVAQIQATGGSAMFIQADLTDVSTIPEIIKQIVSTHGRLDVAFNNAGTATGGLIEMAEPGEWNRVMDTNVKSAYFCLQAEAEHMRRQGSGSIVFNGSVLAGIGLPGTSIYSASKGAITSLTRTAAVELGPFGIRVNCVSPSLTRTPLTVKLISTAEDGTEVSPLAPAGSIPLGRLAEPIEMAQAALFLLSDRASYITGHTLIVDGGQSAR